MKKATIGIVLVAIAIWVLNWLVFNPPLFHNN